MRIFIAMLLPLCLGACAAVTENPWAWLDDPEQQQWKTVIVNGHGREIRFSVPDRLEPGGEHIRPWPVQDGNQRDFVIDLPLESLTVRTQAVVEFVWEWYWGGFYKEGNFDFSLEIWISRNQGNVELFELSAERRLQSRIEYYQGTYSGPEHTRMRAYFFDHYWVIPFSTSQSLTWIVENQPQITADHQFFRLPISDHHELVFSFFVRKERFGGAEDPEWMERRWQLARKIVDTVRIIPNPYQDSP